METTGVDGGDGISRRARARRVLNQPVKTPWKDTPESKAPVDAADVPAASALATDADAAAGLGEAAKEEAAESSAAEVANDGSDAGEGSSSDVGCQSTSMCLFVGQEVRIHLVDLVRTRLACIPPSCLGSMNSFFREMYTREIEQDAALAELYVEHSSSRKNTSLRPSRRIRGVITAFYTTEERPLDTVLCADYVCGVEICFRVGVSVHLSSSSPSCSHEFAVYRRWNVLDFLSLRRVYCQNYSADVFVEKRTAREGAKQQVLSAAEFFRSLHPDFYYGDSCSGDKDPFLLNGSPLPLPSSAAANSQTLTSAGGTASAPASHRRRGRPRKFPRPEETAVAAAQGLSLQQQQQQTWALKRDPAGGQKKYPQGTTVHTLGAKFYITKETQRSLEADRKVEEEREDPVEAGIDKFTLAQATVNARTAKRRRAEEPQQLSGSSARVGGSGGPSNSSLRMPRCGLPTTEGNTRCSEVAEKQRQEQNQQFKQQQQQRQHQQQRHQQREDQQAQVQQEQEHQHQEGRQEEGLLSPCGSVASGTGELVSPPLYSSSVAPHLNADSREALEKVLLPYYRRCLQLLLSGLLGCLNSIPYTAEAFLERQRAIGQCLLAAASPDFSLAELQTLINPFGRCIKTRAAPNELDIHLQQDLVEDVLHLSRFLEQPAAAATTITASTRTTAVTESMHPLPRPAGQKTEANDDGAERMNRASLSHPSLL